MVHGPVPLHFVGNEDIALIEEQDAEVFPLFKSVSKINRLPETSLKRPRRVPHSLFSLRFARRISATRLVWLMVPRL